MPPYAGLPPLADNLNQIELRPRSSRRSRDDDGGGGGGTSSPLVGTFELTTSTSLRRSARPCITVVPGRRRRDFFSTVPAGDSI